MNPCTIVADDSIAALVEWVQRKLTNVVSSLPGEDTKHNSLFPVKAVQNNVVQGGKKGNGKNNNSSSSTQGGGKGGRQTMSGNNNKGPYYGNNSKGGGRVKGPPSKKGAGRNTMFLTKQALNFFRSTARTQEGAQYKCPMVKKSDCDLKSTTLGLQGACQATHENEPGFASKKDAPA